MGAIKQHILEQQDRDERVERLKELNNMESDQEWIDTLADIIGIETDLGRKSFHALCEAAILLDSKNRDYGPGNISAFGERGVVVRLNDKVERLKTLVWNGKSPEHEKVADTWIDITNYGIIGLLCHKGVWK